jgi:hypothetical protein
VQRTMQPVRLWQSCLWAALHSCFMSFKRGHLLSMAKDLALCLIMTTLLPDGVRHKHGGRSEASAGVEQAEMPMEEPSSLPYWLGQAPQEACVGHLAPAQDMMQG